MYLTVTAMGTKTKVAMEEELQRQQSLEEEEKVSDPVKHKHGLDGESQEPQGGFLMEDKEKRKINDTGSFSSHSSKGFKRRRGWMS